MTNVWAGEKKPHENRLTGPEGGRGFTLVLCCPTAPTGQKVKEDEF